jgi:hypothetical protein
MISDLQTLGASLAQLDPEADDFDLQADQLVMGTDPLLGDSICQPIFEFFEAHPLSYAGAPGAFVHQIETFYPSYVPALIQSVRRRPSLNSLLMTNRILNSPDCVSPLRDELIGLLSLTASEQSWESELRELASKYLARHTPALT